MVALKVTLVLILMIFLTRKEKIKTNCLKQGLVQIKMPTNYYLVVREKKEQILKSTIKA